MIAGRLASKVALITAGANGIGLATAQRFIEEGAKTIICDRDETYLEQAKSNHPELITYHLDIVSEEQIREMVDDISRKQGRIDALVNNAGIAGQTGPIEEQELEDWRACMAVNVEGTFLLTKHVAPLMKSQKSGAIINISSTAGFMGYPYRSPYVASKWAVIGLAKTWAMELGEFNIRVNSIAPGSVDGDRMRRVIAAESSVKLPHSPHASPS